jgi:hypothetical protein
LKLELKFLKENPDGSADITVEYDKEAHQYLIQKAIETIILEYLKKVEDEEKHTDNGL